MIPTKSTGCLAKITRACIGGQGLFGGAGFVMSTVLSTPAGSAIATLLTTPFKTTRGPPSGTFQKSGALI